MRQPSQYCQLTTQPIHVRHGGVKLEHPDGLGHKERPGTRQVKMGCEELPNALAMPQLGADQSAGSNVAGSEVPASQPKQPRWKEIQHGLCFRSPWIAINL